MTDESIEIVLWNYIFENCHCQYIKYKRAYSAYMTLAGYDFQEYELSDHSARVKLADSLFCSNTIIEWFKKNKL